MAGSGEVNEVHPGVGRPIVSRLAGQLGCGHRKIFRGCSAPQTPRGLTKEVNEGRSLRQVSHAGAAILPLEVSSMIKHLKAKLVIQAVAAQEGVSVAEVRRSMQEALDAAWDNPEGQAERQRLFPGGKPSLEDFILGVAADLKERE